MFTTKLCQKQYCVDMSNVPSWSAHPVQCNEVCLCCTAQYNMSTSMQYYTLLKRSEKLLVLKCRGCNNLQHAKINTIALVMTICT